RGAAAGRERGRRPGDPRRDRLRPGVGARPVHPDDGHSGPVGQRHAGRPPPRPPAPARPPTPPPAAPARTRSLPLHNVAGACAPQGQSYLAPEGLSLTNTASTNSKQATARSLGFTG